MNGLVLAAGPGSRRLPTPAEMAEFDAAAIAAGTPSIDLMERAGEAIFREVVGASPGARSMLVLCGPGNNGGDGLVIARLALLAGWSVRTILVTSTRYTPELLIEVARYVAAGGTPEAVGASAPPPGCASQITPAHLAAAAAAADVVVDALLGTGQLAAPRGDVGEVVQAVGAVAGITGRTIAVDIPTGVNGLTGERYEPCLAARLTMTVELVKRGMAQYPARAACGEIRCVSIGISGWATSAELLGSFEPLARAADTHKGTCGHVLILGGSRHMPGAAVLSARAALRLGAGLVTKAQRQEWLAPRVAEVMLNLVPGEGPTFDAASVVAILPLLERVSAVVLGPGLSTGEHPEGFIRALLPELLGRSLPTVVDADALNLLSPRWCAGERIELPPAVITPHPGEAARMLGCRTEEIQRDRFATSSRLHERTGAVAVLKGAGTTIAAESRWWVNPTGNPFMATPGSGDVLSGVIGALLAAGFSPLEAAQRGVWIHGRAGDLASARSRGSIIASDIIEALPEAAWQPTR